VQGLVNFASDIGEAIAVLLPALCYLAAIGCFLVAGWGLWRQAQPDNPHRGRPWVPLISLVLCGVFATFDRFLTKADVSVGTGLQVSLVQGLTSFTPPTVTTNVLGSTPGQSVANIVQLFVGFLQPFGALQCFLAVMAWHSIIRGHSNRSQAGCGIQFVFGILLINITTVSNGLISLFPGV
jgi:hypothetical protein